MNPEGTMGTPEEEIPLTMVGKSPEEWAKTKRKMMGEIDETTGDTHGERAENYLKGLNEKSGTEGQEKAA